MNEGSRFELPEGDQTGEERMWHLPTSVESTRDSDVDDEGILHVEATFIGVGSTWFPRHGDHFPATEYAAKGTRCGHCRWFEMRLFQVDLNDYLLHFTGRSIVPGERDLHRHERAWSPMEVIERGSVRSPGRGTVLLTRPAALMLAQAVAFDPDLAEAYARRPAV